MSKLPKELKEELKNNYIGVPELSKLTGRSARGLQYQVTNGTLPAIKVDYPSMAGYKFMVAKEDAIEFLEDHNEPIPFQLIKKIPEDIKTEEIEITSNREIKMIIPSFEPATQWMPPKVTFISRVKKYILTVSMAVAGKI